MINKYLLIMFIISFIDILGASSNATIVYSSQQLFTIPWGDGLGELSLFWRQPPPPDYEGLWEFQPRPAAISETGGLVIIDACDIDIRRLTRYSLSGQFIAQINLDEIGLNISPNLSISNDGIILIINENIIHILNPDLELALNLPLPYTDVNSNVQIKALGPSLNNSFWCVYEISYSQLSFVEVHIVESDIYGYINNHFLLFSGSKDNYNSSQYNYVSPIGQVHPYPYDYVDQYSRNYFQESYEIDGNSETCLYMYSNSNELLYYTTISDSPGWENNAAFFITWSGDYFTQHATADGLVITKYTLHHDPTCQIIVLTPMPYCGQCPALIEFLANASDPDNDELTYHWDFNGDSIFDGVGDEYTGDPWNPTHAFTHSGIHTVTLKVTDNYQGECITVVPVEIMFE